MRILCGQRKPHTDKFGYTWGPDRYFEGGDYAEKPGLFLTRTTDPALFDGARTGSFSYNIPLKRGVYELHLYFAETSFGAGTSAGGGENSRVFHVAMDGKRILSEFDIVSDAGGPAVADERVFKDISPDPDGMLHIRFMSQRSQPMVSAIKVEPAQPHRLNPIRMVALDKPCMDSRRQTWMPDNFWSGGQLGLLRPNPRERAITTSTPESVTAISAMPSPSATASMRLHSILPRSFGVWKIQGVVAKAPASSTFSAMVSHCFGIWMCIRKPAATGR